MCLFYSITYWSISHFAPIPQTRCSFRYVKCYFASMKIPPTVIWRLNSWVSFDPHILSGVNYTVLQSTVHKVKRHSMDFLFFFFCFGHRLFIKINNIHTNVVIEAHFPQGPFAPRAGTMNSFKAAYENVSFHDVKINTCWNDCVWCWNTSRHQWLQATKLDPSMLQGFIFQI